MKRLFKNIQIGHFRIPKTLNFKMRLEMQNCLGENAQKIHIKDFAFPSL